MINDANTFQSEIKDRTVRLQERTSTVSATVVVQAHRQFEFNGGTIDAGFAQQFVVEDEQQFQFADWADITVRTGGKGLDTLRQEISDWETKFKELLGILEPRVRCPLRLKLTCLVSLPLLLSC